MKKIVALCVSICLLFMSVPGVMAIVPPEDAVNPGITDSNTIPEEVAEEIALLFINDYKTFPDIAWTDDTMISETVAMYHVDGTISAYTFELATDGEPSGYVVISGYGDVPNKILEFSDSNVPVYAQMDMAGSDRVVYTGVLNYFAENVSGQLRAVDGTVVARSEIPTPLSDMRSEEHLPAVLQNPDASINVTYPITDPIDWADTWYEGPFVAYEWRNVLEPYCHFRTTSDFPGYIQNCTPTAITNMLEIVGRYRGYTTITYNTISYLYQQVADIGISEEYYANGGIAPGTPTLLVKYYIEDAFQHFGINVTATRAYLNTDAYQKIRSGLDADNPIHIGTTNHPYYGTHALVGYAYCRAVSQTTGYYLSYVKVADGNRGIDRNGNYIDATGRYLDISSISSNGYIAHIIHIS